jgi:hypothetical protein
VREWHDAPILYISGSKVPAFGEEHIAKLRQFVLQGGTVFSCTECGGTGFSSGMRKVYARMFPEYELTVAGNDHDIYSRNVHYELKGQPRLFILSNGVRPLAIHTDFDLSKHWQLRHYASHRYAFEAAANVFMYVTDKGALRYRGVGLWPEEPQFEPKRTVKLARLRYGGGYDPEPLAYERFRRLMGQQTQTKLEVLGPLPIGDLAGSGAGVATLTGTSGVTLPADEQAALKAFVAGGGTLVIDAAGGSTRFAEAARELIEQMYGRDALRHVATTSPIYSMPGMEIERVKLRRRTRVRLIGRAHPNLWAVDVAGRPGVIFSREDITAGLVGYQSYTVDGYAPESAFALMRNIVLFAAGQGK